MNMEKLLAQNFTEQHPADAALILERLAPAAAAFYLDELAPRWVAAVLQKMASANAAECLARLSPQLFVQVIACMPLDRGAGLLRFLAPEAQTNLLRQLPSRFAATLERLLRYPENCAGALMDPQVLALPEDISASEALGRVRRAPRHALYYLYIVDREQKLTGVVNLRELMLAAPREPLSSIMRRDLARVTALSDRAAILDHSGWRDVHALPVVDDHDHLLGALRYEALRRLESESKANAAEGGALSAVLSLGELCWVGLAGLLTELTAAAGAETAAINLVKESLDG